MQVRLKPGATLTTAERSQQHSSGERHGAGETDERQWARGLR